MIRRRGALLLSLLLLALPASPVGGMETPDDAPPSEEVPCDPALRRPLLESLKGIEKLRVHLRPEGAILEGDLLTAEDLSRVALVAGKVPGVVNLCRLDPEALARTASHLEGEFRRMGIEGLSLRPVGERLLLGGVPASPRDISRAATLCRAVGVALVDATGAEGPGPGMVLFEVSFTELNQQGFRDLGITWPSSLGYQDASGGRFDRLTPTHPLQATLNLLVQKGEGKILSRPRLICRSGESASFLAGGEIPIPTRNKDGDISVLWKHYGIILEVAPRVDARGTVHARVTAEVSTVDRANTVEGIPGILTRRVGTSLVLSEGETVILSGLVNSEDARLVREIPLLSSIPILGELFRSRNFQSRETELVVSLTPCLVTGEPAPPPATAPGSPRP